MNNMLFAKEPTAFAELLADHRGRADVMSAQKIQFTGAEGFDVYNVCQPFALRGRWILPGRVERRDGHVSEIRFFELSPEGIASALPYALPRMEDPCASFLGGKLLIGGTEISLDADGGIASWRTAFHQGAELSDLTKFLQAPERMKDVRLAESQGKIHVFTRPQGGIAKAGRIGYLSLDSLEGLSPETMAAAELLTTQFPDGCWGGVNQVIPLKNGFLGIVGHIARMSEGDVRHYCGMTFVFDPETRRSTPVRILCERKDFPAGPAKRPDLEDVVFLGGLIRHPGGTATLYAGLSDAEAAAALVADPFAGWE